MISTDYLIVGYGIAAACFAKQCIENNKSFVIFDNEKKGASHFAAGMYNPVVLKRFAPVWQAQKQMNELEKTFGEFEKLLGQKYIRKLPVYRIFSNQEEIATWQKKRISLPILEKYLNRNVVPNSFSEIDAPLGFGQVNDCGHVDMPSILNDFKEKYKSHFRYEHLDHSQINHSRQYVEYGDIKAQNIVFAEGISAQNNPFFSNIKLVANKGEVMQIKTSALLPNAVIKSKNFLMPIANDSYYVGSTYYRDFKDILPTTAGKNQLLRQLQSYFKGDFEVISHQAGIRPTVIDRKPIIGRHPKFCNLLILNGLGTRGTFNGPSMAKQLFEYINKGTPIPKEINVERFF